MNRNVSPDYISKRLSFRLNDGAFTLYRGFTSRSHDPKERENVGLLQMKFSFLNLIYCDRPGQRGYSVEMKLASLFVQDLYTQHSNFCNLVGPRREHMTRALSVEEELESITSSPVFVIPSSDGSMAAEDKERGSASRNGVSEREPEREREPFFSASFGSRKLEGSQEVFVKVNIQPLDVVVNKHLTVLVSSLFSFNSGKAEPSPSEAMMSFNTNRSGTTPLLTNRNGSASPMPLFSTPLSAPSSVTSGVSSALAVAAAAGTSTTSTGEGLSGINKANSRTAASSGYSLDLSLDVRAPQVRGTEQRV